jgi:two-component system, OmpR family, sensor histidine kinase MprB
VNDLTAGPSIRMSLGTRIALFAAVAVGVTAALVSLGAYLVVRATLYRQLDDLLLQRANVAVSSSLVQQSVLQAIPAAAFGAADLRVAVITDDGRRYSAQDAPTPPIGPAEIDVAMGWRQQSTPRTEGDLRVVAVRAGDHVALVVAQPLGPTRQTLGQLASLFVFIGGAGIVVAAVAGAAVAQAGLRPVQELTAATENIARTGNLAAIPVSGDDELARLSYSFNAMLAALAESRARQRQLVADAGHELRTPLTSLRTNLDLLIASSRAGAPELPEADRVGIYDDVRAQLGELTTLVGDLVELARDDVPLSVHEPVEMADVVERAVDRARRRAPGITFDVRVVPWTLLGDANALERTVLNLLDNAAKWSPPGGLVRLELRAAGDGTAILDVVDSGPGISDADLPHVFDRFYRSAHARTMPGSGLGLAIVKQVVERHDGAVVATRAPEGGALLRLYLPGRPPPP